MRCGGCGFQGPPPPEDAARLARAQQIVQEANVRERQLGPLQTRMLTSELALNLLYAVAAALALVPYLCCVWLVITVGTERGDYLTSVVAVFPVALLLVFVASGFFFLRARLKKIRVSLMSLPPLEAGHAASCRLCGGDIQVGDVRAVVRCSYCDADNLVDPAWLRSQERARDATLDSFEADVGSQARIARQAFRSAWRGLAVAFVLAAPLTVCIWFAAYIAATGVEGDVLDERYTAVQYPEAVCLARVLDYDEDSVQIHGTTDTGENGIFYAPPEQVATFGPDQLTALRLVHYQSGDEGMVESVVGLPLTNRNQVYLRYEDGTRQAVYPSWTCLAEGQASPVPPRPTE